MSTADPHSAERIRERFLQKIGIDSPHQPQSSTENVIIPSSLSCLGDVVPFKEPLKVCLDDDSSFDEDDEFDDDDFFFGDDEGFEAMAIDSISRVKDKSGDGVSALDNNNTNSLCASESATYCVPIKDAEMQQQQPFATTCSSVQPPSVAVVSDEGSSQSSSSEGSSSHTDIASMASSSSCRWSTGNLTYLSQDSLASTKSQSNRKRSKRRVCLDNDVSVIPIPMRTEYSDRVRERLWTSATELLQNAARNSIEFAAEGWNWRHVKEDEDMFVCSVSGELIHPIHLHNALQMHANNRAHDECQISDYAGADTPESGHCIPAASAST